MIVSGFRLVATEKAALKEDNRHISFELTSRELGATC
jgi:hypothetical protein